MKHLYLIPILGFLLIHLTSTQLNAQITVYESEPNNLFSTADPLAIGDTMRGAISTNSDEDVFVVTIPRAGVFDVSVTNIQSPVDMRVDIFDANYGQIGGPYGSGNSNGSPLFFRDRVCPPGIYYFRLEDYDQNQSASGQYKFVVQFDTTDVYECNNTFQDAAPISLGDTIRAAINNTGDRDYFKVSIPRAGVFDVSVTNVESPVDIGVALYDANQASLAPVYGVGNSNGAPLFFRKLVCDPGIYYFRIEDIDQNQSARGLYKFVVQLDTTDKYECNNTIQDAAPIALGDTIRAAINNTGDRDFFKVTIPRQGVLDVSITNIQSPLDIGVALYDVNQGLLNPVYGVGNSNGTPLFFRKLVCDPGIYYFRIDDIDQNESARGLYKFVVQLDTTDSYECNNAFQDASAVALCDTLIGTFSFNGDEDYYSFDAQANQALSFTLTQVPSNINPRVRIFDSFQTQLYDRNLNFGQPLLDSITTPVTGQYYMLINDRDNNANSVLPYRLLLKQGCITTAIDPALVQTITLLPNPAHGRVSLFVPNALAVEYQVQVYDAQGKLLQQQHSHEEQVELETELLPPGIYLVGIQAEGLSVTKRLVILR